MAEDESNPEQPPAAASNHKLAFLEHLNDPEELLRLINLSARVSRTEIRKELHKTGWIVAEFLSRKAVSEANIGLARSADIYLKRIEPFLAEQETPQRQSNQGNAGFTSRARLDDDSYDDDSIDSSDSADDGTV